MKRVICFDLWGTLVSSPVHNTYEDYLAEYWPRELIQETVRDLLMTSEWLNHPLVMSEAGYDRSKRYGTSYRDHLEMVGVILTRLWRIKPKAYEGCFFNGGKFDLNTSIFTEVLMKAARLWYLENEKVEWIPGAEKLLKLLRASGEILGLVTNTTVCGAVMVDDKLPDLEEYFSRCFYSSEYSFAKPSRLVWESLSAERCFQLMDEYWMIGNDPVMDIAVPAAMGWKTILVNHPDGVPITDVPKIIGKVR
ncbi:MAG: hypothetical protein UV82_C0010G0047 [Candidatus Magasanikbacteria bacterium GW2011_GWD2_43_18]|uniref:HAD family hydrolase n=1 Tax=Candidatus Magasanikbacteria bacterium GW2011_GWE2_42_7 TaxID=1619052 RepID=A0A0G1BFU0_9BACT|nr:MAG: hypothetical protein UV18_C0005G0135 [Candidatus Magasanikbacteria bacterium GW2011_GWC2_42_27]KKS72142.1 MAG: hypothetical protein UV42_C0013G0020 [Candidatus Magasanikbacteria bacterium GW2011_GWE2_42_7]KKT04231.1 MAG: hypothetical protein UV82_C0010G0047 [Candidatus Magasanikbacteria bacterium GW2011_GWD2_43_18]KKT25927.1 MAG: hypothetical protein UW10_C0003G0088 [Candidatus Magasanikbacteria bacterium GW2011_GWA2_43_9]HBB37903.1 hypothetical protein [Candidatus Magasanikbacteria bac